MKKLLKLLSRLLDKSIDYTSLMIFIIIIEIYVFIILSLDEGLYKDIALTTITVIIGVFGFTAKGFLRDLEENRRIRILRNCTIVNINPKFPTISIENSPVF